MDRLKIRLKESEKACKTLRDALSIKKPTALERDGTIQRFEYTFEAVWKVGQLYLVEGESLEANSPKGTFRALGEIGILSASETINALAMADDRNKTVHMYIEAVAIMIYKGLKEHSNLLDEIISRIVKKIGEIEK
ncbi:MAG: nucleotidyltransferase substrate binding protein [Elusimicrobiota bacterium]|nr:nucleotidyltransferase substrate binding protein [Elusimicrobiota bacterium]